MCVAGMKTPATHGNNKCRLIALKLCAVVVVYWKKSHLSKKIIRSSSI